ncbi:hypothetical protein DITRI_Ditri04bG0171900 [Diplodiscus trichospermus]
MKSENEDQCQVPESKPEDTTRDFHKELDQSTSVLHSYHDSDACRFQSNLSPWAWRNPRQGLLGSGAARVHGDACRFQSNLSHWAWRNPERGLLGSGAFARVHRGVAETPVPVVQGNGIHQLNRSSQPYQPPHLCKANYHAGRASKDHYNDDTFDSRDNLCQDIAVEEKVRRDSFELMRNEQETATQEKQKIISDEHRENLKPDIAIVLADSGVDKKVAIKYSKSKGSEPCDVYKGHPENPFTCFSDLTHELAEGEKKTAADQKVIEYDSTKFSFGTNGFGHDLIKSASAHVTKEFYGRFNPGVISCERLEEPILPEIDGHYLTQHHSLNGRGSYDVEDSQLSGTYYDAASHHFIPLLQKGASSTDLAECCSKLDMWSKSYVSETQIVNQLNKSGGVCISSFEKNHQGPISRSLIRDSQPAALTCTRKGSTSRFEWDDNVESQILLPLEENCVFPLTLNECGSTGDNERIMFSSFLKQTGGGQESKHSSLSSFDELDICLPDEDSLITVDDYLFPQESMFVAAGGTSSAQVDALPRLPDCAVVDSDNKFDLAGFASPVSFHGSHDLTSLETYFNSLRLKPSNPRLHHYPLKPAKTQVSRFKSQESQKDSRVNAYNIQSSQQFPTNVHLTPPQHLQAAATGFCHSGNSQLLQELPAPGYFPPQQLYGLPRVAFPQLT